LGGALWKQEYGVNKVPTRTGDGQGELAACTQAYRKGKRQKIVVFPLIVLG